MSDIAAWPIRVGGIYNSKSSLYASRITAIEDGEVYTVLHNLYPDGRVREHDPNSYSQAIFRRLYAPEDASPVPFLTSALSQALDFLSEHADPSHPLIATCREALGRAA